MCMKWSRECGSGICSCRISYRQSPLKWTDLQTGTHGPIEPHLVAQIMCAVYSTKRIPFELQASREAMEEFASAFAKERKWRVWLVLSKRIRV